jgi:hypothetical protein
MYRLAGILGGIWIGLCFAAFLSGAILLGGAPSWLPLPWSDLEDFVEGPDGRVYVGLGFYHRILCYSREGQFIASFPPPSGKGIQLAADTHGHIYCLPWGTGSHLGVYNGDWQLLREYSEPYKGDHVWRLQAEGDPAFVPAQMGANVVDRPAKPGDIIFGDSHDRRSFDCTDGTTLIRCGSHLDRLTAEGQMLTQYAAPLILRPFTFPWPAGTAWPLMFLMVYIHARKKQWASQVGIAHVGRWVLWDVVATVLLIAVVGSIWFGGLKALIDFNNSHSQKECAALLLIPTAVWFFFWPLACIRAWKVVQRKLGGPTTFQEQ